MVVDEAMGLEAHPGRIYGIVEKMAEHLGTLVFRKRSEKEEQVEDIGKECSEKVRRCDCCHRNQEKGDP